MAYTANNPLESERKDQHPALQLLLFVGIFIGILLAGNLLAFAIIGACYGLPLLSSISRMNVGAPHFANALWILQIVGTTIPIFTAAVVFAYKLTLNPRGYLKPRAKFPLVLLVLVLLIGLMSAPVIEMLSNINQQIPIPSFLNWMKDTQKNNEKMLDVMLQMKTIWALLFDIIVIGLLTAIAEEFMFRGIIQSIFVRWTNNSHAAVWITAALFSAFHMDFYGFLPRLLLGVLFGYFVVWSGSIWPAIWAHFINNTTDVVITYLAKNKIVAIDVDSQHFFSYPGYIISIAVVAGGMFLYKRMATKQNAGEGT
jgi:membrane protease YdiL (CAAX protease family)